MNIFSISKSPGGGPYSHENKPAGGLAYHHPQRPGSGGSPTRPGGTSPHQTPPTTATSLFHRQEETFNRSLQSALGNFKLLKYITAIYNKNVR